jgi:hypothetical protein
MLCHPPRPTRSHLHENICEDDDEAAQHTEAFLASLLYDATHEDNSPVEVTGLMMSQDLLMTDDECDGQVETVPAEAAMTASSQGHTAPQESSSATKPPSRGNSQSGDSNPANTTFFHELLNRTRNRRPAPAQPAHTVYHLRLLAGAVNPAARKPDENPISYKSEFAAELTTVQDLDLHESRIYQKGYTPEEIRHTIKLILRQISPGTHLVNFNTRNIPP